MLRKYEECQQLPHYPLHSETLKILTAKGGKVFPVRHLSKDVLVLDLLEFSKEELFSKEKCQGELHAEDTSCTLDLRITDYGSHCVRFSIEENASQIEALLEKVLDPVHIGKSIRPVPVDLIPESYGISYWYHGAIVSDLFVWGNIDKGINHALLSWNSFFWEWKQREGYRTGTSKKFKEDQISLSHHKSPFHPIVYEAKKILENADKVDSNVQQFLLLRD